MSTTTTISTTLVSTTAQARPGELYEEYTALKGRKVWIYVKNAEASSAFAAGTLVTFPNGADAYDEVKISAASTGNPQRAVGVAQHAIAILREGEGTVKADATAITADTGLVQGNGTAGTVDSASAITDSCLGWAHTAIGAGVTGLARINCRG
jgi:hypothetical protein